MSHGNPRDKNKRGRGQNLRTGEGVDAPVQLHAVTLHHLHVYELPRGLVWYSVSYCNNFNITLHCCVITVITVFPDPLHLTTSKVRECNKDRKKTSKQLWTMLSQRGDSVSARTVRWCLLTVGFFALVNLSRSKNWRSWWKLNDTIGQRNFKYGL